MSALQINDDALKAIVTKAILDTISAEQRDILLKSALEHLMAPGDPSSFGKRAPSPLERAFQSGVERYAYRLIEERLENDPAWKAAIDGLLTEAWAKFVGEKRTEMAEKLSSALGRALLGERY